MARAHRSTRQLLRHSSFVRRDEPADVPLHSGLAELERVRLFHRCPDWWQVVAYYARADAVVVGRELCELMGEWSTALIGGFCTKATWASTAKLS